MDPPKPFITSILFNKFCSVCEKVSQKKNRDVKKHIVQKYIAYLQSNAKGESLHPILRLLIPFLDRERGSYGIKEYNMAKMYVKLYDLPKDSKDAIKLMNYKNPESVRTNDTIGDFAEVAYWIIRNKSGEHSTLTIGEVNNALDKIAKAHAEHLPRNKDEVFLDVLIRKMSAEEQKWLIRIILKRLHFGVGANKILEFYHPDALTFMNTCNSLLKMCSTLSNRELRMHEVSVSLFEPFRPMLCLKVDLNNLKFQGPHIVETKLDGERFQIHYRNGEFKFFSRNGFENTSIYGSNENTGYFAGLLKAQIKPEYESFIWDGELMTWHKSRACLITQGTFKEVRKLKVGNEAQPCFFPFDVLYCNGKVLTNKPLEDRLSILQNMFVPKTGIIMATPRKILNSNEEIIEELNKSIDGREEGIIVKEIHSVYKPNERLTGGWFKIKPEYLQGALTELDVLIIGGYFGEGKFKGLVSQFLVGLAVSVGSDGKPTVFESLSSVASGFTIDELDELRNKLNPHWIQFQKDKINPSYLFGKSFPDVYIQPSNSCILQVKASQIIWSKKSNCGYTLRFPRVQKIRYDKSWHDCLTSTEFHEIRKKSDGMLTTGHLNSGTVVTSRKRKAPLETLPQFKKQNFSGVNLKCDVFNKKQICVVSGTNEFKKEALEKLIFENGGKIVCNPNSHTFCLIAGDRNIRVNNFIKAQKHVITNISWILDCISEKRIIRWNPCYILSMNQSCKDKINAEYDKYGDNYFEPTTKKSLQLILDKMKVSKPLLQEQLNDFSELLFKGPNPFSCLKGCLAYFADVDDYYNQPITGISLKEEKLLFKFLAGFCCEYVNSTTDYIIISNRYSPNMVKLAELKNKGNFTTTVVNQRWIQDCWASKKWIDDSNYIVNFESQDISN